MKKIKALTSILSLAIAFTLCACPEAERSLGGALSNANSVIRSEQKHLWGSAESTEHEIAKHEITEHDIKETDAHGQEKTAREVRGE